MPFSIEDFFLVFGRYNEAIWPTQAIAYVAGGIAVALIAWGKGRRPAQAALVILAVMWGLNGIVYHGLFFSAINPLAMGFAVLFVIEAAALGIAAVRDRDLLFALSWTPRGVVGVALVIFAMAVYPLWGWLGGHIYPQAPLFGVAPCPTAIFTVGVLFLGPWRVVRGLLGGAVDMVRHWGIGGPGARCASGFRAAGNGGGSSLCSGSGAGVKRPLPEMPVKAR